MNQVSRFKRLYTLRFILQCTFSSQKIPLAKLNPSVSMWYRPTHPSHSFNYLIIMHVQCTYLLIHRNIYYTLNRNFLFDFQLFLYGHYLIPTDTTNGWANWKLERFLMLRLIHQIYRLPNIQISDSSYQEDHKPDQEKTMKLMTPRIQSYQWN
jgi:hypothetical protein